MGRVELDALVRHVAEVEAQRVPAYTTLDAHVGYRFGDMLELSLVGQNLLEPRHAEWAGGSALVERTVYVKVTAGW